MAILQRESRPHPELRRWMAPVNVLFAGADAGAYTLPESYIENRSSLDRLQAAIDALGELPDLKAIEAAAAIKTAENAAVRAIKPETVGKVLLDAEAKHEQLAASLHVLRQAQTRAAIALSALLSQSAEEVVVEHLRPAQALALTDAESIVPKLGGVRSTDELLAADGIESKREAWLVLESLAVRWRATARPTPSCSRPASRTTSVSTRSTPRRCCRSATLTSSRVSARAGSTRRPTRRSTWCGW